MCCRLESAIFRTCSRNPGGNRFSLPSMILALELRPEVVTRTTAISRLSAEVPEFSPSTVRLFLAISLPSDMSVRYYSKVDLPSLNFIPATLSSDARTLSRVISPSRNESLK